MVKDENNVINSLLSFGYTKMKGKKGYISVLKISEYFIIDMLKYIEMEDSLFIQMDKSLPMIFPPAPWSDYEIGGYYLKPTFIMRVQGSKSQEDAMKFADLGRMFEVLNCIGSTAWKINKKVLEVSEQIWSEGGNVNGIPNRYYNYKDYVYEYMINECTDYEQKRVLLNTMQN